jgi:hypothetical protein
VAPSPAFEGAVKKRLLRDDLKMNERALKNHYALFCVIGSQSLPAPPAVGTGAGRQGCHQRFPDFFRNLKRFILTFSRK